MRFDRQRIHGIFAGFAVGALALLGHPGFASAQNVVEAARAALPEATRQSGLFRVVTTFQWPPFNYKAESGELDGIDATLARLLAAKMGLKADFTDSNSLPAMLSGVDTGRYDVIIGNMGITAERVKAFDFVPTYKSGYGLIVKKGTTGLDINNLCGHKLSISQGSSQVVLAEALSKDCVAAGKPAIVLDFYPGAALAQLAVASGRAEGFIASAETAVYTAKANPQLEAAPGMLKDRFVFCGIVVAKNNPELRKALALAVESAMADGSFQAVLDKWQFSYGALTPEQLRTPAAQLVPNW